jgi:tripartite-type tricarboxylate transporter receptor subunit TctC
LRFFELPQFEMRSVEVPYLKRRTLLKLGAALSVPATSANASTTMRIIVGAPPGGSTDTLARAIAPEMARTLNATVVVENRSGAGGNIAAEAVAKAAPDGNTLLLSFTSHTINATLYPQLPFDPIRDFTPLTMVATSPSVLVVHPSLPVNSIRELIAYAKKSPGKLNMAVGSIGSSLHLAGDAFKMQAGVFIVNIPYRGTAPALADVVAGNVPMMFAAVGNARRLIEANRLKALAVTSPQRLAPLPEVPALAEVLPGFSTNAWFGLFGPAGMDANLTTRISNAARSAVRTDAFRKRLEADAAEPVGNAPSEFSQFIKEDIQRWAKIVKYSGAKPE